MFISKTLLTHSGKFHADDVFATAWIILADFIQAKRELGYFGYDRLVGKDPAADVKEYIKEVGQYRICTDAQAGHLDGCPIVVRTNRANDMVAGRRALVYDIGLGKFDHHQADVDVRPNGIKYAAFGLLVREFGPELMPAKYLTRFDSAFVQSLDDSDNGGNHNSLATAISGFMPLWYETSSPDAVNAGFKEALVFAAGVLYRELIRLDAEMLAEKTCNESPIEETDAGRVLVLEHYVPANAWALEHGIIATIYPSLRGGWQATVTSDPIKGNLYKFPESWRGVTGDKLMEVSGLCSLTFCHATGFTASCQLQAEMIKACGRLEPVR